MKSAVKPCSGGIESFPVIVLPPQGWMLIRLLEHLAEYRDKGRSVSVSDLAIALYGYSTSFEKRAVNTLTWRLRKLGVPIRRLTPSNRYHTAAWYLPVRVRIGGGPIL